MSVRFGARLVISRRVIKHCLCISREICTVPSLYRPSTDGLIKAASQSVSQSPSRPMIMRRLLLVLSALVVLEVKCRHSPITKKVACSVVSVPYCVW